MEEVPEELVSHVFSYLDARNVLKDAALVCKKWYGISTNQLLWKSFCEREGWELNDDVSKNSTTAEDWKQLYKQSAYSDSLFKIKKKNSVVSVITTAIFFPINIRH